MQEGDILLVLLPPFTPCDHIFLERVPLSLPNKVPCLPTGDWTGRDKGRIVRSLGSPSSRGITPPVLTLSRETSVDGLSVSQKKTRRKH